jgi:hypothetical protein
MRTLSYFFSMHIIDERFSASRDNYLQEAEICVEAT